MSEYKRPTKRIDLPSGKKVDVVEYFTAWEVEEIQGAAAKGVMVNRREMEKASAGDQQAKDKMGGDNIPIANLLAAYRLAKEIAIKKLVDEQGIEYVATVENVKEFLGVEDGEVVNQAITEMMGKKK